MWRRSLSDSSRNEGNDNFLLSVKACFRCILAFITGWWSTDSRCAMPRRGIDLPAARDGAPLSEVRGNSPHKAHFSLWTWFHSDTVFSYCEDVFRRRSYRWRLELWARDILPFSWYIIFLCISSNICCNLNASLYIKVCQVVR